MKIIKTLNKNLESSAEKIRIREVLRWTGISSSSYYYGIEKISDSSNSTEGAELSQTPGDKKFISSELKEIIKNRALEHSALGYKKVHRVLKREGVEVSRRQVYKVMKKEGLLKKVNYRRKNSKSYKEKLKKLIPSKPNGLWQMDVTYIKVSSGTWWFVINVIDYFSRYLLSSRFTPSYSAWDGVEALKKALKEAERIHGKIKHPIYLVTDNGTTFTAKRFKAFVDGKIMEEEVKKLFQHIRIGYRMPQHIGLIERYHQNLKQEAIYPYEYENGFQVMQKIKEYVDYYNYERPHWALNLRTPAEVYTGCDYKDSLRFRKMNKGVLEC